MLGLVQNHPLLLSSVITHAARFHGRAEIVSLLSDGSEHRTTYAALEPRCRRLAQALATLGIGFGDRVSTLAWNDWRHLELYYGVSGSGAVLNTVNVRLTAEDIAYVINQAGSKALFIDPSLLPLLQRIASEISETVRDVVILAERMPAITLPAGMRLHAYEDLLAGAGDSYQWPRFDENTASVLTYTSGTTGRPKGVLYSHRSSVLQSYAVNAVDVFGLRAVDRVLVAVSLYHATAWTLPYSGPMAGASLILPGRHFDGPTLHRLLEQERVTYALAVPTIWSGFLEHLQKSGGTISTLKRVLSGGSAVTRDLLEAFRAYGVRVEHAWGMTEGGPVVAYNAPVPATAGLTAEAATENALHQGRPLFGANVRIVDEAAAELAHDGTAFGELLIQGPSVARGYFLQDADGQSDAGWFPTGDIATIDQNGYIRLVDRRKDLIKSGGEWISSLALEDIALGHEAVAEAAAIAAAHPKWGERPLLLVVARQGQQPAAGEILARFEGRVARWWIPDQVILVPALPRTAVGKIDKRALRAEYGSTYLGNTG